MAERTLAQLGSMLRPLKNLKFLGREPVTLPMQPRPAAEIYRGFHLNDWELCIGCGTCASICDNRAIRMVHIPDLPADPIKGVKPHRPAIDYGRCCWCGLCVDICPSGSISLSREYVHVSDDLNTFFILPDPHGMHGADYPKGWQKSPQSDLLDLQRQAMPEQPAETRSDNFTEIAQGYDVQAAIVEASRCIQCGMCHDACPTHMHAPEYIRALWSGDADEAVRQIYRTNPLASVCGRVCTHRCEAACSIGRRGEPVAIRWLKRFAMDSVPHEKVRRMLVEQKTALSNGKNIAIIGAGPAGLTAAYDLARAGCAVTIYDALPQPGGMMRYGIPDYRLPHQRLDEDIDVITAMGVTLRCGIRVGVDVSMDELRSNNDAVIVATGLHAGRSTRIPGTDHHRVVAAIALLRQVTLGEFHDVPRRAVVIGGGNVAMDAARTLARLQRAAFDTVDVTVTALESLEQMLADPEEISEAREEGVVILPSRGPRVCIVEHDALSGLETVACTSVFDDEGRFHPRYDESDVQVHGADMIVEAIGQAPMLEFLGEALTEQLAWEGRGLKIDGHGQTSEPWLWAAGDVVEGPDVIHAIAGGHRVAAAILHTLVPSAVAQG